jgi:hypothetical protein
MCTSVFILTVLWELFTHSIPWSGLRTEQIIGQLMRKRTLTIPNDCPSVIIQLCTSLFDCDDSMRPTAAQTLDTLRQWKKQLEQQAKK